MPSHQPFTMERRNSSGTLLSPEIEVSTPSLRTGAGSETSETNDFYHLKKESQRRTTLSKVLTTDESKICDLWLEKLHNEHGNIVAITKSELQKLIHGIREYIMNEKEKHLEACINSLKEELNYDGAALDHLHLALYSFQEAVISVLRLHSIKPHWMFALDNLVKQAVQACVMILSPELGANLLGKDPSLIDDESVHNQQHTSTDSQEKIIVYETGHAHSTTPAMDEDSTSFSSNECVRLLRDIKESNRKFHHQHLEHQKQSLKALHNISRELAHFYMGRKRTRRSKYTAVGSKKPNRQYKRQYARRSISSYSGGLQEVDEQLEEWLTRHDVDEVSKSVILNEGFSYEDFIYNMDKLDLMRLELR